MSTTCWLYDLSLLEFVGQVRSEALARVTGNYGHQPDCNWPPDPPGFVFPM